MIYIFLVQVLCCIILCLYSVDSRFEKERVGLALIDLILCTPCNPFPFNWMRYLISGSDWLYLLSVGFELKVHLQKKNMSKYARWQLVICKH